MLASRGLAPLAPLASLARGQGRWDQKWLVAVANDLERNKGNSLIVVGRRQPGAVHALAAALNVALANLGNTVDYSVPLTSDETAGPAGLGALAEEIASGNVDTLVITASNPVYGAPIDFKLGKLLERVPNSIYYGLYEDETAAACKTMVPAAHPLESWGDLRATDGTVSIVQPLIAPLWGGIQEADVLAAFVGEGDVGAHELLRQFWKTQGKAPGDFDGNWERWLADGIVPGTAAPVEAGLTVDGNALAQAVTPMLAKAGGKQGMEIAFVGDPKVYDGRFANNVWLQELPHPITKLTWDNAAMISEATAASLGLEDGDVVEVSYRDRRMDAPILRVPGHADDVVTLPLGYGREGAETVAKGVGFNAGALRASDAPWFDRGVKLEKTGRSVEFSITQDHWTMAPDGRETPPPAVEATVTEVLDPKSHFHEELEERRPNPEHPQPVIHQPVDYSGQTYKWAMAIDLTKCTGCSACVVACQAENNIPIVGKEQVRKGREMHWIRIDRYYPGSCRESGGRHPAARVRALRDRALRVRLPGQRHRPHRRGPERDGLQPLHRHPVLLQQLPLQGPALQLLRLHADYTAAREMRMNPDVTVRTRGVMEKCTYCVQRIERTRIATRIEGRTIQDGELETACQQACPTRAIVFGSLNDASSKVSQLHADPRRYDLLHELGTRPRTVYLAKVRNPNPELALKAPAPVEPGRRSTNNGRPAARRARSAGADAPHRWRAHRQDHQRQPARARLARRRQRLVGLLRRGALAARHAGHLHLLDGLQGHRRVGQQHPGRLGVRHHQLRLVDRHRPRRDADLRDPAAVPAEVAHVDQPLRRGDDAVRGHLRAALPADPHRASLVRGYWLFPYPSTNGIWPQFKSPLTWDVFAVSTYFTISLLFWFLGLIPDLAALRDSSKSKAKRLIYGALALGWRGSGRHWAEYKWSYLLLAGLSTPLVLSVHTIVSFDFATSVIPGWHTTIFPPYFVAGAVFSGFAMVMTWMIPARRFLGLKHVVTMKHLENMNKVMLVTGMIVTYGYLMEHFIAWYSGDPYEFAQFFNRACAARWRVSTGR